MCTQCLRTIKKDAREQEEKIAVAVEEKAAE